MSDDPTLVSYLSFRPKDHFERNLCCNAAESLATKTKLHPLILKNLDLNFRPVWAEYVAAMDTYQNAVGAAGTAAEDCVAADATFDATFRIWKDTVKNARGMVRTQEISGLLGGRPPSEFVELPYNKEVVCAKQLFEKLETRPSLAGDAASLAAFRAAYENLAAHVAMKEEADRVVADTSATLASASKAFDLAWGMLVRVVQQHEGKEQAKVLLPVFRRTRKVKGPPVSEEPAGSEESEVENGGEEPTPEIEPSEEPAPPEPAPPQPPKADAPEPSRRLVAPTQPPSS